MPEYNLAGLSAQSFEQLVQAIAVKVIGPGTVVFGSGPDGGREATFEGRMTHPSMTSPWDGYLVLQAKFLQRPRDTSRDGAWALRQLKGELEKFDNSRRKLRIPEYYIFCTNVVLSPVDKTGYKDRIREALSAFASRHSLMKDFAVWDYDQLRTFIDGAEDVRRAYLGWITPGDVLRRAMDLLDGVQPDFHQLVSAFLQADLLDDRFARLDQAGHSLRELTPMGRLFIDLTVSVSQVDTPPDEKTPIKPAFLAELLAIGAERLDPSSISATGFRSAGGSEPGYGRYVLIGGPGQGKTTIGQFACQLYRAAILDDRPNLVPEVRDAIGSLHEYCRAQKIGLPKGRRFPIRIVLNEFARELAEGKVTSLVSYISSMMSARSHRLIRAEDLHKWLTLYPFFLVLDGLDEVPPSTNRDEVLRAITGFLVFANDAGSDMLVLATTRPQGYNAEFSPEYYRHRYLTPLSLPRAMQYAARLANVTHGEGSTAARDVVEGLKTAAETEATARLMRSPLQVTIMATLVARGGPAPQERWVLFRKYYNVIYDRETAKRLGDVTPILRSYRTHIDAIHFRVGLMLQIESEHAGQTNARLPTDSFAQIVSERLSDEGKTGETADSLREAIIRAASERLVFLVGVREGQVGFEIRSLQEFMAAEALMDGPDDIVIKRLNLIGPISHWNNVFLFAAGKCFADRTHLRGAIIDICASLNERCAADQMRHVSLTGSQLALLLLEDGVARQQWTREQVLARVALRIQERSPSIQHQRIASAYHSEIDGVYEESLASHASELGTFSILVRLAERGVPWAVTAVNGILDKSPTSWPHVEVLANSIEGPWGEKKLASLLRGAPTSVASSVREIFPPRVTYSVADFARYQPLDVRLSGSTAAGRVRALLNPVRSAPIRQDLWSEMTPWRDVRRFSEEPSTASLAMVLEAFARLWISDDLAPRSVDVSLPWIIEAVVNRCVDAADLSQHAITAKKGGFGSPEDWIEAERRWVNDGVSVSDLVAFETEGLLPSSRIRHEGFPFTAVTSWSGQAVGRSTMAKAMLELWKASSGPNLRSRFAQLALQWGWPDKQGVSKDVDTLVELIKDGARLGGLDFIVLIDEPRLNDPRVLSALDVAAKSQAPVRRFFNHLWALLPFQVGVGTWRYAPIAEKHIASIANKWMEDRTRVGLLYALGDLSSGSAVSFPPEMFAGLMDDERAAQAAVLLSVGNALEPDDINTLLSKCLLYANGDPQFAYQVLMRLRTFAGQSRVYEDLLVRFYIQIPPAAWRVRQFALQVIDSCISSRRSDLSRMEVREQLTLPKLTGIDDSVVSGG